MEPGKEENKKSEEITNLQKKKFCHYCENNDYQEKWSTHLRKKHRSVMEKRESIKNLIKYFTKEQLIQIEQLCLKTRNEQRKSQTSPRNHF